MGRTDLHYAALDGAVDRVDALVARREDPDAADQQGFTALHFAAQSYTPEVVDHLLAAGAAVDPVNVHGNTPLGVATFHSEGRGEVMERLLAPVPIPIGPTVLARVLANWRRGSPTTR